ncbi:hypothetical protein [Bradyrhizobium sp. RP6]|uniref:hypothetical protein n=1 Tax=Bradyrhizobium sp. RP6 TaxID=2489596 RepID=UPI000F52B5A0|nr:hypothetical protein [Bradyrhizobium sp. RP6]RQH12743.1 hypothetical protein EHH60_14755 [Bradyrhizobium sp. RP6]
MSTVDFRSFTSDLVPERATHLLHAYPAKLIPHIPNFFLNAFRQDASKQLVVADPFCGSGTVLVEGLLNGFAVLGADSNPLARLIARVKTRYVDPDSLLRSLARLKKRVGELDACEPPRVVNLNHWYKPRIVAELSKLRAAIATIRTVEIREFMEVCFSVCARKMSMADPRLSVPVRINMQRKEQYAAHARQLRRHLANQTPENVFLTFSEIVRRNAMRVRSLMNQALPSNLIGIYDDARSLHTLAGKNSVDLIVTSPPYIGAQKYIRSSSLGLGWLGLARPDELRSLEKANIGREHYSTSEVAESLSTGLREVDERLLHIRKLNPLRAHIAAQYFVEMRAAFASMHQMLKPGGCLVLVIGPNTICNQQFDTPLYLENLAHEIGLEIEFRLIDHIRSRGLMTKRNRTAGMIASEWVLCLRKQSAS